MLGFLLGLVVGVSLGVAAGGLIAPSSGTALRARMKQRIEAAQQEAASAARRTGEELLARFEEAKR